MLTFFQRKQTPAAAPASSFAMIEKLEPRQLLSVTINPAKIKIKNLFDQQGRSINQSELHVPFSETVQIVDASKIRMIGYVQNPVGGAQRKVTIRLSEIRRWEEHPNQIIFKTDRLSPRSGRIIIDPGAIRTLDGTDIGAFNVQPPKGQNKERFTLASRAFRATDVSIYSKSVHPTSPNVSDMSTPLTEGQVTPLLLSFLGKKVQQGTITAAQRDAAMARYNDPIARQIIPSANLRAALVSLVGTIGEPAIAAYLDGKNITGKAFTVVDFSSTLGAGVLIAETKQNDAGRLRTLFRSQYAGEPFQVLSAILAHESLHQDANNGQQEEIMANTVETFVHIQQAMAFRGFIFTPSNLTRSLNDQVLAMMNSGSASFPRVGVLRGPILGTNGVFYLAPAQSGGPIFSFEDHIRRQYAARGFGDFDSAGNETLQAMYKNMTGNSEAVSFNRTLISKIDSSQTVISDKNAIKVAGLFGLTFWTY